MFIAVAGGSGSGKTYMADRIKENAPDRTLLLQLDRYYKPFAEKSRFERMQLNFDDPDTLDWELLKRHIQRLQNGEPIDRPEYSFEQSTRVGTETVHPRDLVICEGIFALHDPELTELMDLTIYLDPDPDVRAIRRMKRDIVERNRSAEFVAEQYLEKTKKMHEQVVEPTRSRADLVLDDPGKHRFINMITNNIVSATAGNDRQLHEFFRERFD